MFDTRQDEIGEPPSDLAADLAAAAVLSLRTAALVRAAADAVELRSIAELAQLRRTEARADAHAHDPTGRRRVDLDLVDRCTAQEVSTALWLSPVLARDRLELALELVERRPATFTALRAGDVDLVRARRITDGVRHLAPDHAAAVEAEALLPGSVPDLADRHPGRLAGQLTPAQLTARLNRLALRADPHGAQQRTAAADRHRACTRRALPDGMALFSVTGRGELLTAAFTRIDATARALIAAETADNSAGNGAEHAPRTGPTPGVDAARTLDQTRADVVLALLLGHSTDLSHADGVAVSLSLVAPAGTVLAGSDEPGELLGYGPLPAPLVRELAADAVWQRWTSDPTTGHITSLGRRHYRPSAAVADLVRARDLHCRFPTCQRTARNCDLDHVTPFPQGETHEANLATECRLHHLTRHRSGFRLRIDPDGTTIWTTPTGHTITEHPPSWGRPPPAPDLSDAIPPPAPPADAVTPPAPQQDDPPPF